MKKAMVFGAGVSGLGAEHLLENMGYEVILVDDKKGISSKDGMEYLDEIEIFVKSPGVPYNELVMKVKEKKIKLIDEIELSYEYMLQYEIKSKIIAVTGTNGKTTTTSKITELLQYAGFKAEYAGNIGVSFAEVLLKYKDLDYIVLELSSYQLENLLDFKPWITMVINLTPDHLSRYKDTEDYYKTKFNIGKNQTERDYFIFNLDSKEVVEREKFIFGKKIKISQTITKECDFWVENGKLYGKDGEILECGKLSLKGKHNLENILFIVATAKIIGIQNEKIREFLYNTGTIEHRMEDFFNYGKIKFINDSKGTNIDSTKFAVEAFDQCVLICGGFDKKLDWSPLAELIKIHAKETYLIGETADEINRILLEKGYDSSKIFLLRDLRSCLLNMKERLNPEKAQVILLSPATSSFDQFNSYEHRGEVFKELVREIFGR
ncbi:MULTISPECIES: UDP-N-acetylmuramoyl-L-alanine--D-glutamate ligase [Fusobacterium]|uniref:UDP-N-acetylmuramoyl-L-alanine--D-glutamate ligase n=1 Tax=Fusobacterium TaxID=848 RepID=UPI0008A5E59B|nr:MULTISPECIES: UDP-N-acetylmuramoyl-L-alanine--D-glutamate ligase [Fusobacterium]OFL92475.1 UDP-N-acetylmuramoylalanine--D-glutamate ligase [Fusobacterium sp. HMSC073F01]